MKKVEAGMASKLLLSVISVISVFSLSPAAGAYNSPQIERRSSAYAQWTTPDAGGKHDHLFFEIEVRRVESPGQEMKTTVSLVKGWCEDDSQTSRRCLPQNEIRRTIPSDNFTFDETLDSAEVRIQLGGTTHHAIWEGMNQAGPAGSGRYCDPNPAGDQAEGIYRSAQSSGKLFGHKLKPSTDRYDDSYLSMLVGLRTCG